VPCREPYSDDWSSCNYHKYKFKTAKKTKGSGYHLELHHDVRHLHQPALIFTLKGPPALFVVVHKTAQPNNEVHAITEEKYKKLYPTCTHWKGSFSSFEVSPGDAVWLESGHKLQHCVLMTEDCASHESSERWVVQFYMGDFYKQY